MFLGGKKAASISELLLLIGESLLYHNIDSSLFMCFFTLQQALCLTFPLFHL